MTKLLSALLALCAASPAPANEGMWAFHGVPKEAIRREYGFSPSPAWLDHLRLSSVRINDGGSGSFVSPDGLVLTNHHVALGAIAKLSTPERDLVKQGFSARRREEEIRLADTEINILVEMVEVTKRVEAAVAPGASGEEANAQRKAEIARIEDESAKGTGLRSDVVGLYQGGEYWLYRYKKFTDVRLVMAPEAQAAFFGGDPDNFTYPRYDLDMTFLRVYEDGKPYKPQHHLKWGKGLQEGELAFVSGHPGRTQRLKTLAQLRFIKDLEVPAMFDGLSRQKQALDAFSAEDPEQARQAKSTLFSLENALKVYSGRREALKERGLWERKEKDEADLRAAVEKDPVLRAAYGPAWAAVEESRRLASEGYAQRQHQALGGGRLAGIAAAIVNLVEEVAKPNGERWEEYRDSGLASLKHRLYSPAPVYPGMEKRLLALALRRSLEALGEADPFVAAALAGRSPEQVADEAVSGTKLLDPAARKALVEGGKAAVEASDDPLVRLALKLAPFYRQNRTWYEKFVEAAELAATTLIAKARFAVLGRSVYPDATFTLRLSFGKAAGYEEGTTRVPYKTTFYGLYDRADSFDGKEPWDLAPSLAAARGKVALSTPLNLVTTNDIIGGNSGSPVVNRKGELVGLIFDGNIQSLVGDYMYSETQSRAVAVHAAGMIEALVNVYGMGDLAAELTGRAVGLAKRTAASRTARRGRRAPRAG